MNRYDQNTREVRPQRTPFLNTQEAAFTLSRLLGACTCYTYIIPRLPRR